MVQIILQIVRFGLVGFIASFVDFSAYFFLTRFSATLYDNYIATSVATSVLAFTVGFFFNNYWTFRQADRPSLKKYGRYLVVYGLSIVWQNIILILFVETMALADLVSKILAILVVGIGWNFLLVKLWVFRYNKSHELT